MAALVDKSIPTVVALFDAILHEEGRRLKGPGKNLLFYIAHGLAQRIPLIKLVELDGAIYPYLATLMVATLAHMGKTLVMPERPWIMMMAREAFNNMLLKESSCIYDNYGLVSR